MQLFSAFLFQSSFDIEYNLFSGIRANLNHQIEDSHLSQIEKLKIPNAAYKNLNYYKHATTQPIQEADNRASELCMMH